MLILTSWDDGHPCDLRLADLLNKYNLKGTFFIPYKNSESRDVLNEAQIRVLDRDFEIGGHTLNHRYLTCLNDKDLNNEIVQGKLKIENIIGHSVSGFCYPGGYLNQRVIDAVRTAGFSYARTVENMVFDTGKSVWEMPTSFQFYPHSSYVLIKNMIKYPDVSKLKSVVMRATEKDFFRFLEKQLTANIGYDRVFHLWGHSWEIEQYDLWDKLEQFFELLSVYSDCSVTLAEAQTRCLQNNPVMPCVL